ncbi:hypothetical protein Droror1_Dr00024375 [Drosera rotundifolia]
MKSMPRLIIPQHNQAQSSSHKAQCWLFFFNTKQEDDATKSRQSEHRHRKGLQEANQINHQTVNLEKSMHPHEKRQSEDQSSRKKPKEDSKSKSGKIIKDLESNQRRKLAQPLKSLMTTILARVPYKKHHQFLTMEITINPILEKSKNHH